MRAWVTGLIVCVLVAVTGPAHANSRYAAVVVDYASGRVLHERNADKLLYPASLTKMMTLYMLFDALDDRKLRLDSRLAVSRRAAGMPASRLGLKRGTTISVEDAIRALVTKSANDVAVVIGEALGGTEIAFASMMTKRARAIGMSRTTFKNASGLPNRHQKSTARDMATLAMRLIRDHGDRYAYFSLAKFDHQGRTYRSHNRLLKSYRGMDGLKTGYIRASGFNLAASAMRDGRRLVTVVFGGRSAKSRDAEVARLMDAGFERLARSRAPVLVLGPPALRPDRGTAAATVLAGAPADSVDIVVPEVRPARRGAGEETQVASIDALEGANPAGVANSGAVERSGEDAGSLAARIDGEALPVVMAPISGTPPSGVGAGEPMVSARPGLRLSEGDPKLRPQGGYAVQVGAYHDPELARRAAYDVARKVPKILLKGNVDISRLDRGRKPVYRARIVGFSRAEADEACRLLARKRQDCLVLRTGPLQVAQNG